MKYICSRCGSEINDILIRIDTSYKIMKVTETGLTEVYENMSEPTSEILCEECFNKYADKIDELNEEYNGKFMANTVQIIDDVQYGDTK